MVHSFGSTSPEENGSSKIRSASNDFVLPNEYRVFVFQLLRNNFFFLYQCIWLVEPSWNRIRSRCFRNHQESVWLAQWEASLPLERSENLALVSSVFYKILASVSRLVAGSVIRKTKHKKPYLILHYTGFLIVNFTGFIWLKKNIWYN